MTTQEMAQEWIDRCTAQGNKGGFTCSEAKLIMIDLLAAHSVMLESLERMQLIEGSTQAYIMKQIAREAVEQVRNAEKVRKG